MLITLFLVSLAAAVAVGVYTFGVLFGTWSRPPNGPFVAPPPPPRQALVPFAPFIPPVAPAVSVSTPAPHVEQATSLSSVFVTLPMQHQAVPAPTVTARGSTAARTVPRTAKGSVPPPLPSRPVVAPRAARAPEPSDFLDEETYLDVPVVGSTTPRR